MYNEYGDNMAKKKKTNETKKNTGVSTELTGLILILVGLIGFGFGPVGALLKKFAMFLMGEWWPLILIFVLILGFYMLIKRKLPSFFGQKYIGFYLILIVITIVASVLIYDYIEAFKPVKIESDILNETIENVIVEIENNTKQQNNSLIYISSIFFIITTVFFVIWVKQIRQKFTK